VAEPWYRAAFGAFYPVLYAHRDQAEAQRCLELLPRLASLDDGRGLAVLDLGCGDGRHLAPLRAAGYTAIGLDLSWPLLMAARGQGAPLVRADMSRLPVREGACGAVLSLFTAFGYFGRDGDAEVVGGIARALAPGGHWFLDYLDAGRVMGELADGPLERTRVAGPLVVTEVRRLDVEGRRVVKAVTLAPVAAHEEAAASLGVTADGLRYEESVALYTLDELDTMAAGGGLRRVASAGDYDGVPVGQGSRWLLAYRKGTLT
jgi:SAM-dependent methyltransferase